MLEERLRRRAVEFDDGPSLAAVVNLLRDRAQTLEELTEKSVYFFEEFSSYDESAAKKHLRPVVAVMLTELLHRFKNMTIWDARNIHAVITALAESYDVKLGKVAQPVRVAVSGVAATPPID